MQHVAVVTQHLALLDHSTPVNVIPSMQLWSKNWHNLMMIVATYGQPMHTGSVVTSHGHVGLTLQLLCFCARSYEFKFLLEHRSGHLEWENGTNRTFTVPKTAAEMLVQGKWGSTQVRTTHRHSRLSAPNQTDTLCHAKAPRCAASVSALGGLI